MYGSCVAPGMMPVAPMGGVMTNGFMNGMDSMSQAVNSGMVGNPVAPMGVGMMPGMMPVAPMGGVMTNGFMNGMDSMSQAVNSGMVGNPGMMVGPMHY